MIEKEEFERADLTKGFDRLHLSKKIPENHLNRDFMKDVRHKLREKPDQHLSPLIWNQSNAVRSFITDRTSYYPTTRRTSQSLEPAFAILAKKAESKSEKVMIGKCSQHQ